MSFQVSRARFPRRRLHRLIHLAIGAPVALTSVAALADTGPACQNGGGTACQIIYTEGSAGHSDGGATGQPIVSTFTDPRTLTAINGPTGWGAVQLESVAGAGGNADHDGNNGGQGGQGNTVSATIGPGVTATGANSGGIVRLVSAGGNGGGGQGDHTGSPGKGGTGGGGGEVDVTMNGTITSTDAGSPGIVAVSQGGSTNVGDSGSDGFFGAESGNAGGSAYVNVNIGGSIATVGTGAWIAAIGGNGVQGVNDSGGVSESEARAGGNGGSSVQAMNVVVTGNIASSQGDGIDVQAVAGAGGNGGDAHEAPSSSTGGNGGTGGSAPDATLTIGNPSGASNMGAVYGSQVGALVGSMGGNGGNGGTAGNSGTSSGGVGGDGGNAGAATLNLQSGAQATGTGIAALVAQSIGGNGGAGGAGQFSNDTATGGNGGEGGQGGNASIVIGQVPPDQASQATMVNTSPATSAIGVLVQSVGGDGGDAALAVGSNYAKGGIGGAGNIGGAASVTLLGNGSVATQGADSPGTASAIAPGVLVRSSGGAGGAGGNSGAGMGSAGGSAGAGGDGGTATAVIDGSVSTSGSFAYGVLAQSLGGMGQRGGDAGSVFGSYGGAARNGGTGDAVYLSGQGGSVTTAGTGAAGMVAQSVGGGGGSGGNATTLGGGGAIGGNGGGGGNGGNVTVGLFPAISASGTLSDTIITRGDSATALMGQSVGGAGGNGGNSITVGTMVPSLAIGGDGNSGGIGGTVNVRNDGLITTQGQQSGGVAAQSVGGGGGNGGAGVAINAGVQISTSFALGGAGKQGGAGGTVELDNYNQVSTYGADAFGLKAQSISGGGGQGGSALATAIALGGDPEYPTTSVSVSLGGSGGAGGDQSSSPVTVNNHGLITTAGDGAIGIIAQNVAGGGGNGGDATAASYANGGDKQSTNISVSSTVGGKGAGGGTGGSATANNDGLVVTKGADAYGVFAQSVAGGGGVGGTGDASSSAGSGENSYGGAITVGGQGGQGGTAGSATITTTAQGNVATGGDGANALFAQSVAGGGGASGGGTAKANSGNITASLVLGGNAGSGGQGGTVSVTNQASLLTKGAEADAVFAQSLGGGGGKAGKGASTTGGAQNAQTVVNQMSNTIATGLGLNPQGVTKIADGVYKVGDQVWQGVSKLSDLQTVLGGGDSATLRDDDDEDGNAGNLKLNATLGGQGGIGGNGGQVTVTNAGSIETDGTKSDGIFAQSLGGGGGVGGASSFSGSSSEGGKDDDQTSGSLKIGGSGAGAGAGSTVQVTHTGSITTNGVSSYGIDAQSVGGGGGKGGATASSTGALKDFSVTLGGSGGAGGAGGDVTVNSDGSVTTNERQSFAILAQSVGGGGGTAHLLSSDISSASSNDDTQINLTLGGSGGAGGNGGNATVNIGKTSTGTIRTNGVGGIGVVAQSIGGGGGTMVTTAAQTDAQGGGNGGGIQDSTLLPISFGDATGSSGNGGTVSVTLGSASTTPTSSILTNKANAYGILAQSVGGGGGLFAGATPATELAKLYNGTGQVGNGGAVTVILQNGGWVYTSGAGAVGVFAQSVGGGGGVIGGMQNVNLTSGLQTNPTAESGQGGNVLVDLESGGNIVTTGAGAHGIIAQSFGGGGGVVAGTNGAGYAYAGATNYNCGSDCTGNVSVTMGDNTVVQTHGKDSYGIVAQSRGNGSNNATIGIGANAWVESRDDSAGGIYVEASGSNTVTNAGNIAATASGTAIASAAGNTLVHNESGGVITGTIDLTQGTGTGSVQNDPGGTINSGSAVNAVALRNGGTLEVGGAGNAGARTVVSGALQQGATGRIVIDSDHVAGLSDRIVIHGDATLAGELQMRPTRLSSNAVQAIDVKGTLDSSQLRAVDPLLVHYQLNNASTRGADGSAQQSIVVTPQGRFGTAADGLGKNAQSVAAHLQANFDAGAGGMGGVLAQLAGGVQDAATYKAALTSLGNEAQQAVGTSRLAASQAFVERMNSCPTFDDPKGGTDMHERECLWGRIIDERTTTSGQERANYSAGTHSVQIGGQKRIGDGWFLGGSAAYSDEDWSSSAGAGTVDGNGGSVGVVLKREMGPWTISGAADVGYGNYDTVRNISYPGYAAQASGSFDLSQVGLHSRIAYLVPQANWYLKPYVDVHAVYMHTSSYSEQGAGALGLNVNGNGDTQFSASPMLEVGGRMDLDNGITLRPYAAVGATFHDKNEWGASAQFEGAAPGVATFDTAASAPTSLANVRLGLDMTISKNLQLRAEYGGRFGSGYRANEGVLRVNYLF